MKKFIFVTVISFLLCASFTVSAQEADQNEGFKPALIVIDVQKAFIGMMDQNAINEPIEYINAYVAAFKQLGYPVIYIYHTSDEYGVPVGSEAYQFIDDISILEDAPKITKTYGNAFNKTELDSTLKALDCNTLFLCGLSASGCVFATFVGGQDMDYNTYVLKNAIMSPDEKVTKVIEEIVDAVGPNAMKLILENLHQQD